MAQTKGTWIGQDGVANVAYAKSQTGDSWKVVTIDNPVKYGLTMYEDKGWLVVQFNDSTYQKRGGGNVDFIIRPDTLFGIPQPVDSYGHGVFFFNPGNLVLETKMRFRFKCSEINNYHPQSSWQVYHAPSEYYNTPKMKEIR